MKTWPNLPAGRLAPSLSVDSLGICSRVLSPCPTSNRLRLIKRVSSETKRPDSLSSTPNHKRVRGLRSRIRSGKLDSALAELLTTSTKGS